MSNRAMVAAVVVLVVPQLLQQRRNHHMNHETKPEPESASVQRKRAPGPVAKNRWTCWIGPKWTTFSSSNRW
uniref:Putative secreted protein n=1 Tax=Anopheles triannulatus TaxID=58253 RepID=A0A2M4B479_9DIPT